MSEAAGEVKLHFLDYWRVIRVRWGIILLAFLLVMITASVTTYFMPKKYRSEVALELKFDARTIALGTLNNFGGGGLSPTFVTTQYEIITKPDILLPVIKDLKLQEKWGADGQPLPEEYALMRIRNMIQVRQVRNTEMLEISAMSTDNQEAADIANAVASVYEKTRTQQQVQQTSQGLESFSAELDERRKKVQESQAALGRLRTDLGQFGIIDIGSEESPDLQDPTQQVLLTKEQEVNQARTDLATISSRLEHVERLSGDELIRALATLKIDDPTVAQILPLYKQADAERARLLNSGLGPKHPDVMAVAAQMAVYEKQLREQSGAIRQSLATEKRIQESKLAALETQLEDVRKRQQEAKAKSAEYVSEKLNLKDLREQLRSLETDLNVKKVQEAIPLIPVRIWGKAQASSTPASPNWVLNLALGAVIGLVVGVGLAFFIEYLDTSVKTMEDVEKFLGVPVLAIIPKDIELLHKVPGDTPDAEAYRILRTNIEFNRKSATANTISMVSGGPGEGKSTTLANMAYTFAQGGYSVLIVDADLRRPTQHKLFEISNDVGLTTYLTTDIRLEDVIFPTGFDNLHFMPSGILPTDAVGILNSQRMSDMIGELKSRYDMVFFDSPPILGVSDASVLASEVDLCILVVQHRRFPRSMLSRVKQSVINVGGTILGVVLNNVDLKHDPNYQYYTSYYDYYTPHRETESPKGGKKSVASVGRSSRGSGAREDQY